jgi:hypothetical protein
MAAPFAPDRGLGLRADALVLWAERTARAVTGAWLGMAGCGWCSTGGSRPRTGRTR